MKRRTLSTGPTPKILIETRDDLVVTGWDQPSVTAEAGISDELLMEQSGNVITVAGDSIRLSVPRGATCIVESCAGQAALREIRGTVSLGSVGGSLILEKIGSADAPTTVESVGGEFSAHDIGGALTVQLVGGHAILADVAGPCALEQIGGHLELTEIGAGLQAQVGGHASLAFNPVPGQSYRVEAGGNILCTLPDSANAELRMESPVFSGKDGQDTRRVLLGEGGAIVNLEASGAIRINHPAMQAQQPGEAWTVEVENEDSTEGSTEEKTKTSGHSADFDIDLDLEELGALAETFATDLAAKITSKLGVLSDRLPGILASAGLSNEEADEISRQVKESTMRAAERAQAKAHRAAEKAARKAERRVAKARRKAEQAGFQMSYAPPQSPRPPRPPQAPTAPSAVGVAAPPPTSSVTSEERMTILRMLEEKKISVAQAETLLAALEGRS